MLLSSEKRILLDIESGGGGGRGSGLTKGSLQFQRIFLKPILDDDL